MPGPALCPDCRRSLVLADPPPGLECLHCGFRTEYTPADRDAVKDEAIARAKAATAAVRAQRNPPPEPTPKRSAAAVVSVDERKEE